MASGDPQNSFLSPVDQAAKEPRSLAPWIIAGVFILLVVAGLLVMSHHAQPANPGGAGLAAPDPYAANLKITDVKMSQTSNMAGAQLTYIDGNITNSGTKTVTGITVQVAFHDFTGILAQKSTLALNLIRTHEPYVDTQPVSAAPIKPGETREFRLIFDHVPDSWNQQYPELRIIEVD
ncbi:DUF2393 family protein [Silvibacterium dinghuense]|uniref:DUF2393 domain-containing protein n=1 Tax=Silvibacterium dinghuense TaxID=1560006 RepID=A0A4Q1SI02_9BACT|nr:DUF2393 family protein [Silvibacterium dinghuense]RXS97206.1 DUF2393 domain-containing protein [Silvibacterium dinghuense]GGG97083.1 hypothetical protein GCM10011586_10420 [Silvibacterium dinghuense]